MWTGVVREVWPDGDMFTAELRRDGGPDLIAEFSMRECGIYVEEGDVLRIEPDQVTKIDLGIWTVQEVREIRTRAEKLARELGFLAD
jgi:hypothetical protein